MLTCPPLVEIELLIYWLELSANNHCSYLQIIYLSVIHRKKPANKKITAVY